MFVFIFIAHGVALIITRVRLKVVDPVTSINFNKGHLTFNIYLVNAIGLHGPNLISCKQKFRERRKVGRPWLGNNLIIGLKHQTLVLLDRTGTRQQVNQFYQYIPDSRTKIILYPPKNQGILTFFSRAIIAFHGNVFKYGFA